MYAIDESIKVNLRNVVKHVLARVTEAFTTG